MSRTLRKPKMKNILVDDSVSFEENGMFIEAVITQDHFLGTYAIHTCSLHIVWNSVEGDVANQNRTCEKRASWLYLNASVVERGTKGGTRRKATEKKQTRKKKLYKDKKRSQTRWKMKQ